MINNKMPDAYIGKEQAYIKHTILKSYIQRLFMIIGLGKETVINYVDCFAGPWQEEDDDELSDTSIGISLKQMATCQTYLESIHHRKVKFRALYIEKDPVAFAKLKSYLGEKPSPSIETHCLDGDYTKLIDNIIEWQGGHFTFFFVDPMGWQQVVGAKTMLPLLRLENTEFLINLMYEFINRFVSLEKHADDMVELFGDLPRFDGHLPEERREILLDMYRNNMKCNYGGRTTYVPVQKPGTEKILYYLVYLTRNPRGIDVFKEQAEKMEIVQRITQQEVKLRNKIKRTGMDDLFADESLPVENSYSDNRLEAKEFLLNVLTQEPLLIDYEVWADWLEKTDLYPTDFQLAIHELLKENKVKNLDGNVSRRRKNFIKPDWADKSERWSLI